MKFSIQEEGKEKSIFFTFKEASEQTGIPISNIWRVLKRENKKFKRKDGKVFFIQEEETNEPFLQVDGEDIFDYVELEKFGISSQCFLNQILRKKKHFLDSEEITHYITWKSPEFDFFIDTLRQNRMDTKIVRNEKGKTRSKSTINHKSVFANHKDLVNVMEQV